jgi:ribosome recycling factor
MHPITTDLKSTCDKTIASLKEDLKSIRTGRANASLIEGLIVETYGGSTKMKLMEMATITTEGASTLVVMPYDSSTSQDIEKAILKSPLGISPQPQAGKILVKIPPLSEEQRQKLTKIVSQKIEEKKVSIRGNRDEARKKIKNLLDQKQITEDQKFRFEKEIDTVTQKATEELQTIKEAKEQEILTI